MVLERADNYLGRAQRDGGADQTGLTLQNIAALTKAHGFTAAAVAEIARRLRAEVAADRRTPGRAGAAAQDAHRADKMLVLAAAEQQAGGYVQRGSLALGLDEIAGDEIAYWKTLREQAALLERLAPAFAAAAANQRAWKRRVKARAFPTRAAAAAAYRRGVDRPLEPGLRLLTRDYLLQRQAAHDRRALGNSIFTLAAVLRRDSSARRQARHLIRADPQGFLASRPKRSG